MNTTEIEPALANKFNQKLHKVQAKEIAYSVNNTFGFGGHIATIIFKKYKK